MADRNLNLGTIFTADIRDFIRKTTQMKNSLNGLNAAYRKASGESKKSFDGVATGAGKADKAIKKSGVGLQQYSKQIGKVEGAWKRTLAAMKVTASYGLAASAIFALINALKAGVKEIIDFDQALKNLQAITRATDAEVMGMGDTIKDVAQKTKFSTGEVAEGMVLLGQAGFSATEAMQSMQSVADLATGTLGDMKTVSDLVTTSIRAFGLSTIESARVADVMANAINRSKLTIDKLRTAFNFVGAAAAQTGLSLEEVSASMMLLANHGLRASTIGTGLRQVLARLLAPNRNLREEFENQGIALDTVNPKIVGYQEAMKKMTAIIYDQSRGMVDMTKAYRLFGLRGAQAAAILAKGFAGTGPGSFQDMLDKTYEVGSAAEMAAIQMEGLGVKIKNLADRAKLIAVAFGEGGATGAFKIFIDALRAIALGIKNVLESDIGRIIVSFGVWATSITLVTKGILVLVGALRSMGVVIAATQLGVFIKELLKISVVAGRTTTAIWLLDAAMAGALAPIALIAAAVGAAVVALRWWMGTTERAIKSTIKLANEASTAANTLKVYEAALRDIASKKEKDIEVSREYSAVIKRLVQAYEPLKDKIDESSEALEENIAVVRRAYGEENQKRLQANIELVKLYSERLKEISFRYGVLAELQSALTKILDVWVEGLIKAANLVVKVVTWIPRLILDILSVLPLIGDALGDLSDKVDDFLSGWVEKFREAGVESRKFRDTLKEQTNSFLEISRTLKEQGAGLDEIIAKMKELGATSDQIHLVVQALEAQSIAIGKAKAKHEESLSDLPNTYKKFYDSLDALRQVDFAKTLATIDKEVVAFREKAEAIGKSEKEIYAGVEVIRARALAKFKEDQNEEKRTVEETTREIIGLLKERGDKIEEEYHDVTRIQMNNYLQDADLAEGNYKELFELDKQFNKDIQLERETSAVRMQGLELAIQEQTEKLKLELAKKGAEEQKAFLKVILKELESQGKETEKKRKELQKTLKDFDEEYQKDLKSMRDKGLSDEQKYYNDIAQYDDLMNRARAQGNAEYYEEAMNLARGLGDQVTDANGEIIKSAAVAADEARTLMEDTHREYSIFLQRAEEGEAKKHDRLTASIKTTEAELKNVEDRIKSINSNELNLQTEDEIRKIMNLNVELDKFKTMWDNLKSKEITLTVNYVSKGKSVDEGSSEEEGDDESFVPEKGFKLGGIVKKVRTSGAVKRREGGMIQPVKLKEGGRVLTIIKGGKEIISRTAQKFKEGGNIEKIIEKSIISKYREGGNVERVLHTINTSGKIERISQYREGGRTKSSSELIRDIRTYKEGGRTDRASKVINTFKEVRAKVGGFMGKLLLGGGKLLGFGGGDIVPAWLEPGEFVIKKEAVLKKGADFFDRLNEMKETVEGGKAIKTELASTPVSAIGESSEVDEVSSRWGGLIVRAINSNIYRFKTGGSVGVTRVHGDRIHKSLSNISSVKNITAPIYARAGGLASVHRPRFIQPDPQYRKVRDVYKPISSRGESGGNTINITVSPTYMTGDRQSVRAIALDLSRALQEQNRRWGVK